MLLYSNLDFLFVFRSEFQFSAFLLVPLIGLQGPNIFLHYRAERRSLFLMTLLTCMSRSLTTTSLYQKRQLHVQRMRTIPTFRLKTQNASRLCARKDILIVKLSMSDWRNKWQVTSFTELKWLIKVTSDWYN